MAVNLLESVLVSFITEGSKAVDCFDTRSKTGAYCLRAVGVRDSGSHWVPKGLMSLASWAMVCCCPLRKHGLCLRTDLPKLGKCSSSGLNVPGLQVYGPLESPDRSPALCCLPAGQGGCFVTVAITIEIVASWIGGGPGTETSMSAVPRGWMMAASLRRSTELCALRGGCLPVHFSSPGLIVTSSAELAAEPFLQDPSHSHSPSSNVSALFLPPLVLMVVLLTLVLGSGAH